MIKRELQKVLMQRARQYPVVTITGPRQSGKSTLCKMVFPAYQYVNLEDISLRNFAQDDPKGFLEQFNNGVILDEIQRVPNLTSQIQVLVDQNSKKKSQFILTGSHNFSLVHSINQSLAGRTGLLTLLPFTINEAQNFKSKNSVDAFLYNGFYPRIYDQKIPATTLLSDYVATYVERDVRQLEQIQNLSLFQKFLGLCAGRIGQVLNLSGLANEVGVSSTTLKQWLSVLEASYLVYLLKPYHANIGKRLVKTPKLYFYDVGLACYLLGIHDVKQLMHHPLRGALFENLVVMEYIKKNYNHDQHLQFYFYRDHKGVEIDLVLVEANRCHLIEIKSSQTISSHFFDGMQKAASSFSKKTFQKTVVYAGKEVQKRNIGRVLPFDSIG